jgi:hypothetical protein
MAVQVMYLHYCEWNMYSQINFRVMSVELGVMIHMSDILLEQFSES